MKKTLFFVSFFLCLNASAELVRSSLVRGFLKTPTKPIAPKPSASPSKKSSASIAAPQTEKSEAYDSQIVLGPHDPLDPYLRPNQTKKKWPSEIKKLKQIELTPQEIKEQEKLYWENYYSNHKIKVNHN